MKTSKLFRMIMLFLALLMLLPTQIPNTTAQSIIQGDGEIIPQITTTTSGTWSTTGNLKTARYWFPAVRLNNDKILVSGGKSSTDAPSLKSAELYDPQTGQWSFTGNMNRERRTHTMTLLADGRVLVTGGAYGPYNTGGVRSGAEIYDPATGTWSITGGMHVPRCVHAAVLLPDGKVLVAGGMDINRNIHQTAEIYDPETGTWEITGSLNVARRSMWGLWLLPNGKVLAAGGTDDVVSLADAELYDPRSRTWERTSSMLVAGHGLPAVLPNGLVLRGGGEGKKAELYDPATETWRYTGDLNTIQSSIGAELLSNGKVLAIGGSQTAGTLGKKCELYDYETELWTLTGDLNVARKGAPHVALADGRVLVMGGFVTDATSTLRSAEIYTWQSPDNIPLTSVNIQGATHTEMNTPQDFTATIAPATATTPITYQWSPTPQSGQGSNQARYTWDAPGLQAITVVASNATSTVTDTHFLRVVPPPEPECPCVGSIAPDQTWANQHLRQSYQDWKSTYVTAQGAGGYLRVKRTESNNDTVSEGIGYGMLLAAYMNDKPTFRKLWAYAKSHHNSHGLMHWRISANNQPIDENGQPVSTNDRNNATDGDIDMALALIVAQRRWSGYWGDATHLINNILQYNVEASTNVLKPGDVWGGTDATNPSYFATGAFRVFAEFTGNNRWKNVISKSYTIINRVNTKNPAGTGLMPDWTTAAGNVVTAYADKGYDYSYDATRTPWRLALDAAWYCNQNALTQLDKFNTFFQGIGVNSITAGYKLDGTPLNTHHNAAFVAPAATAAVWSTDTVYQQAMWNEVTVGQAQGGIRINENYYNESLRLLSILFMTGNMPNPLNIRRTTSTEPSDPAITLTTMPQAAPQSPNATRIIDVIIWLYWTPTMYYQSNYYEPMINYFADAIYEMSNGAHKLGKVYMLSGNYYAQWKNHAHIQWVWDMHPNANVCGYHNRRYGSQVRMGDSFITSYWGDGLRLGGYTLAHEFGHYYYCLYDEYRLAPNQTAYPNSPGYPRHDDIPVDYSIMGENYHAAESNNPYWPYWLNFSIYSTRRTAQHRMYGATGWETLSRPYWQDPRTSALLARQPRPYFSELAQVAPASGQWPSIEVWYSTEQARSSLQILWYAGKAMQTNAPLTETVMLTPTYEAAVGTVYGTSVTYPEPVILIAKVAKDEYVANSDLQTEIYAPDGTTTTITLNDEGIAPDVLADDGLYSGLMPYHQNGAYSVTTTFNNATCQACTTRAAFVPAPQSESIPIDDWESQLVADNFLAIATTVITISQVQGDDHGNTPTTASLLEVTNIPLVGRIDYANDVDVFMTTITQTGTFILRLTNLALDMQPKIRLMANDGVTVQAEFTPEYSDDQYFFTEITMNAHETLYTEIAHQDTTASVGLYQISIGAALPSGGEIKTFAYLPLILR